MLHQNIQDAARRLARGSVPQHELIDFAREVGRITHPKDTDSYCSHSHRWCRIWFAERR